LYATFAIDELDERAAPAKDAVKRALKTGKTTMLNA
jgi:hypothetical protein